MSRIYVEDDHPITDWIWNRIIGFFNRRLIEYEGCDGLAFYVLNVIAFAYVLYKIDFSMYPAVCFVFAFAVCQITRKVLRKKGRGMALMRKMMRVHNFDSKEQQDYYQKMFQEVLSEIVNTEKGNKQEIREAVRALDLYLCDDKSASVYAINQCDICITRGMLVMPNEQIKAMMARAVNYALCGWSDRVYMIVADNVIFDVVILALRGIAAILRIIGKSTSIINAAAYIFDYIVDGILYIYTWIGRTLTFHHDYYAAYLADKKACMCGYGEALSEYLKTVNFRNDARGVFAVLAITQPPKLDARLNHIEMCRKKYETSQNKNNQSIR